jgi:hypothetical protein
MRLRLLAILGSGWASAITAALLTAAASGRAAAEGVSLTVTPAATGEQLVRVSLPLPRGFLREEQTLKVEQEMRGWAEDKWPSVRAEVRPLSWYPATNDGPKSIRRALVTFSYSFRTRQAMNFALQAVARKERRRRSRPVAVAVRGESLSLTWKKGWQVDLRLLAPTRTSAEAPRHEVVEDNQFYLWQRWHFPDAQWPRIIELRSDALGGVVVVAHLQRKLPVDGFAPDFGWQAKTPATFITGLVSNRPVVVSHRPFRHSFAAGDEAEVVVGNNGLRLYHPAAPLKRRGHITIAFPERGKLDYRYLRCTADDRVPMQMTSWRRAEIAIAPACLAPLSVTLESPHKVVVPPARWQEVYGVEPTATLPEELNALVDYHRDAVLRSMAVGDDWGNLTGYADGTPHGGVFGMNRLNHCAAIFEEGWRSGDRRLLNTAVLWCDNFFDQTIWWGEKERGGSRYNNIVAMNQAPPTKEYMWRSDSSVNFCTKGYDAFWLAWEQTGDPRMREALDAQIAYAAEHLHADQGECRNVGDVRDFVRLYRYTGERRYLDEAMRLFGELRHKLSTGDLFDQGGKPLAPDPPFIEEDQRGLTVGYAKPYIIGYALAGLPELLAFAPAEPKLRETVRAVADFLAESQDPVGGWRYPHPNSSAVIMSQAVEHAWQLTQAARALGPEEKWLDAIEATLRQRLHGWRRTGQMFSGLEGWEMTTGSVRDRKELYDLYRKPADRNARRDYAEGRASFGSAPPEGIVYFTEVLEYYVRYRPAARLLADPEVGSPLGQVLNRVPKERK